MAAREERRKVTEAVTCGACALFAVCCARHCMRDDAVVRFGREPSRGTKQYRDDLGDRQRPLRLILGWRGPDTDLRRWGRKLAARGGKNAKKRAVVAVARKLAVLLHRLWVSGENYEPLRHSQPAPSPSVAA